MLFSAGEFWYNGIAQLSPSGSVIVPHEHCADLCSCKCGPQSSVQVHHEGIPADVAFHVHALNVRKSVSSEIMRMHDADLLEPRDRKHSTPG
jgi:hypothetical protein